MSNETLIEQENEIQNDDLNKKHYVEITPTLYIQAIPPSEEDGEDDPLKFKILNPETGVVEERELTDEEKREVKIKELKNSNINFKPLKHKGNITINQFDRNYKKKRNKKLKQTRKSRKANRK